MASSSPDFWWRLQITISCHLEETLFWKFQQLGINRVSAQFEPGDSSTFIFYAWLPASEWSEGQRDLLESVVRPLGKVFGLTIPKPIWERIEDEDWNLTWKKYWKPDLVGEKLLILPSWLELPKEHAQRNVLRLNPGLAFGTGSHPSTRLCLEALEKFPLKGKKVADLGCGSGILGLAALLLKADEVVAVDTDPLAVRASVENFGLNNFKNEQFQSHLGSIEVLEGLTQKDRAELLLCNILAPVIEELAPKFERIVTDEGSGFLSGLLLDQAPLLIEALDPLGWRTVELIQLDQWCLLHIRRRISKKHKKT